MRTRILKVLQGYFQLLSLVLSRQKTTKRAWWTSIHPVVPQSSSCRTPKIRLRSRLYTSPGVSDVPRRLASPLLLLLASMCAATCLPFSKSLPFGVWCPPSPAIHLP
ncbi:hypothetical protein Zmor_027480 [Zophobas morio]|uniref:Uncharacterized protein n=1 Tax=Zophobas morio TaxID=2755281 RepID=A0AA38HP03_9CUCU|nr:hypothetical protein Zmor_027480 [Zophobas morio]